MKKILLLFFSFFLTPILIIAQDVQFCVDVSMNRDSMFFGVQDSLGNPAIGSDYIIQGPVYPAGTFQLKGFDKGLVGGGVPEFPDLQIGYYMSRGWVVQDVSTTQGIHALTTQLFFIDKEYAGLQPFQIILSGREPAALNEPIYRAVVGATDELRFSRGEGAHVNVGKNITDGFNATICFGVLDFSQLVSVKPIHNSEIASLGVFPNPATSQITLKVDRILNLVETQVLIFDLPGRMMLKENWMLYPGSNSRAIDISSLQPGMYLVLLKDMNNLIASQKLVITK